MDTKKAPFSESELSALTQIYESIGSTEARKSISDLIHRAHYQGERILISKHSKPIVAIVHVNDLARLEQLDRISDQEFASQPLTQPGIVIESGEEAVELSTTTSAIHTHTQPHASWGEPTTDPANESAHTVTPVIPKTELAPAFEPPVFSPDLQPEFGEAQFENIAASIHKDP